MSESVSLPVTDGRLGSRSVARIGYGSMRLEAFRGRPAAGAAVLRRVLELGVDHIDTAYFYGEGFVNNLIREEVVPQERAVIATKVGAVPDPQAAPIPLRPAQKPAELRQGVEDNLRSLGVDRLDLVNLRRLDVAPGITAAGDQVVDLDDQLAVLTEMRDEGKIDGIGLSGVTAETVRRALPVGIACVQNSYSVVNRQFEDVLQVCLENEIAWVPFFPLGGGLPGAGNVVHHPAVLAAAEHLGATPGQVGLAWLLHHAPNTLLIPGTTTVGHLEENVAAGDLIIPPATMVELDAI